MTLSTRSDTNSEEGYPLNIARDDEMLGLALRLSSDGSCGNFGREFWFLVLLNTFNGGKAFRVLILLGPSLS